MDYIIYLIGINYLCNALFLIVSSLTNKSGVVLKWLEFIKSKGWLAVITLLSATTAVFSQQYQLSTYNLDEGLSSGLIKAIITDDIGFVWSATDRGVLRFNGKDAVLFKDQIPTGFAKAFWKKEDGQLLVLHDFGLVSIRSNPDTVYFNKIISGLSTDTDSTLYYPKSVFEDSQGGLWIGENQAISKVQNGKLKKYRFGPEDFADSFFKAFSIIEDHLGTIWAMSFNGNLYRYDSIRDRFIQLPLKENIFNVGSIDNRGENTFWIGAENGLFEIKIKDEKTIGHCRRINGIDKISCTLLLNDKEFYIGTAGKGLWRADISEKNPTFTALDILPFNDITGLYYDKNGIWISSTENIALLHPVFFERVNHSSTDHISSLKLNGDSTIYATADNYIFQLEKRNNQWYQKEILENFDIYPMAVSRGRDFLWVGDFSGEVFKYQIDSQELDRIPEISPGSQLSQMYEDKSGNTWIVGHETLGLIKMDTAGKLKFFNEGGLQQAKVMRETHNGILFCAGGNARSYLFLYNEANDSFKDISAEIGFPVHEDFTIEDMAFGQNNELFLASTSGLLAYSLQRGAGGIDGKRVKRIDLKKVPIDEPIKALAYAKGVLWVATSNGLVRYQNNASLFYDKTRGLPSKNLSTRGLLVDYDNTLWIATARGLAFLPNRNPANVVTPKPIFEYVKINGKKQHLSNEGIQSFGHNVFLEARFVSLSYPADRIKYQTRMLPGDSTWSSPTTSNALFIPKFTSGNHILEVRAQQYGGLLWSEVQRYGFNIERPWFKEWWAYLLYIVSFVVILVGTVRFYNWHLMKKNERLERTIKNRTIEIKRQKNKIITQKNEIIRQNEKYLMLKEKQLNDKIEYKNKQLATHTLNIIQKNETLKELSKGITQIIRSSGRHSSSELRQLLGLINYSFRKDKDWDEFKLYFEEVHTGFFENLIKYQPDLTSLELRHCALLRLNMSISESASLLGISPESIKTARFRLRKKLNLESQQDLTDHVMAM